MPLEPGSLSDDQIAALAALLLGAAHADGSFDGAEEEVVGALLTEFLGADDARIPQVIADTIRDFDEKTLDLDKACGALPIDGPEDRRALLSLLGHVVDANDVHDLDESAFLRRVARVIGATDEELADFAVEVIASGPAGPPPLPH